MGKKVSSEGIKEGIIKIIDGEPYYHYKYTDYLYQEIKKVNKEIERLTAESTEWESKCYKYQDIIDELEKWLNTQMRLVFLNEAGHYKLVLDKLKELKEGKENE